MKRLPPQIRWHAMCVIVSWSRVFHSNSYLQSIVVTVGTVMRHADEQHSASGELSVISRVMRLGSTVGPIRTWSHSS